MIYVGDTVDDARSASAAGVPFIGIAAESHSRRGDLVRFFEKEKAIAIIENINEIEERALRKASIERNTKETRIQADSEN